MVTPVVVNQIVSLAICLIATSQSSQRIQLSVKTNQVLAFRQSIDIIAQVVQHNLIGICISQFIALTLRIIIIITILAINSFIILTRIVNCFIILNRTAIGTQLDIHVNLSLLVLTGLSGNKDYTGSTTRTIKSCRSSILQHGNILNIILRNVAQRSTVRSTVHNDKRFRICIQRSDTTDFDTTLTGTRSTGTTTKLKTRSGTNQSIGYVSGNVLGKFFRANHCCRTGK